MTLEQGFLWVVAVGFAAIGVGFLSAPVAWARYIEILVPTPTARTDLRATYGGFVLAFGVFLGVSALWPDWTRAGLAAAGLALAGVAAGRLIGILVEGVASRLMYVFLFIEITGAVLAFYALVHHGRL
ncbi:MAG: DUF4345 domain-containing protein [Gemmatimonadota bacterium]|nr:DUF4345 domain-containing protein [Gemmatimonadota bacterium]MDH3368253.1 DUF4345 domain-containing protein [Gemmatimonadota bacterium]MDH3478784.1 DUF4345 domain-containing protein [Gemmatimonadota bacterium]MDH3571047.1 DUF4345 domain-containing protein [Gemmatimonadota bacterium]MDH5548309.1 DUF4345 domain-containing protein [Gemmatimonadota bacterium]